VPDRVYCPDPVVDGRLTLTGEEAHHLIRVRRVVPGELVTVFDGRGAAFRAEVREVGRDRAELIVVGEPVADRPAACVLTLATAVPKGDRFDWLVEKATELGVARLVPLITERSVVDPRGGKLDRLRRRVIEASKQCGRNRLMELASPIDWPGYLHAEAAPARLLAHPGGLPAGAWAPPAKGEQAALAVGPEGGFTPDEIEAARAAGWREFGLGPTVLRIETAGLAGSAVIFALWGGDRS
jgi:16S rRNA (uracil1498-N3)-methyltransferase